MVVQELQELAAFQQADEVAQLALLLGALLHDVAKPHCTFIDDNQRVVSPHHAQVGEKVARALLWDLEMSVRERVCALVRLHGLPLWSLDKPNPNRAVIAASLRLANADLATLVEADIRGRICQTQDEYLERLAFFTELCIENECFVDKRKFYNQHSQFKFFYKDEPYPCEWYDDTEFEIVILCGIAGSGKDTYARLLGLPVVSLDDLRAELGVKHGDSKGLGNVVQLAYNQAKKYCAKKQSFIWNATSLTRQLRSRIVNALSVYNPRFKIVYIETSMENIIARRAENIPESVLWNMQKRLEMPMPDEAHEVVYYRN